MYREIVDLENNLSAGADARLHQIPHHLLLRVDGDRAPTSQFGQMDAVTPATETEPNPIVPQSLTPQTIADAGVDHQIHRALLQHACAHAVLDILAAAALQNHRTHT